MPDSVTSTTPTAAAGAYDTPQAELAYLHETLQHRARQLSLLNDLARELTGLLDSTAIFNLVTQQLWLRFGYYSVEVFQVDKEQGTVVLASRAGAYAHLVEPGHYQQTIGQGIIGAAAHQGEIILANRARQHPSFFYLHGAEVQAELAIPLLKGKQVIGVLNVDSEQVDTFDETDVTLLKTVADQMVIALEKSRLFENVQQQALELEEKVVSRTLALVKANEQLRQEISTRQRTEEALRTSQAELKAQTESLSLINAISETLYRTLDFQAVVERAVNALVTYARFRAAAIFTLNENTQTLDLLIARNFSHDLNMVVQHIQLAGSLGGRAVANREIVTSADLWTDEAVLPSIRDVVRRCGVRGAIVIPILYQTEVLGTVHLLAKELPEMNALDHKTLIAIGRAIGLAMSNARYVNQIEREMKERHRVEAALQESESRFRRLAENAPDIVFRFRFDPPAYEYMNQAVERITGWSAAAFYADYQTVLKVVHPEEHGILYAFMQKQIEPQIQLRLLHVDGSVRWLEQRHVLIYDEAGEVVAVEGIGRDITDLKEALKTLQGNRES